MKSIIRDYDWNPRRITQELETLRLAESEGKSQSPSEGLRINEAISDFMKRPYIYETLYGNHIRRGNSQSLVDLGGPKNPEAAPKITPANTMEKHSKYGI